MNEVMTKNKAEIIFLHHWNTRIFKINDRRVETFS